MCSGFAAQPESFLAAQQSADVFLLSVSVAAPQGVFVLFVAAEC